MKIMHIDDVVINEGIQDDVDTLWRWGDENWELWDGEKFDKGFQFYMMTKEL